MATKKAKQSSSNVRTFKLPSWRRRPRRAEERMGYFAGAWHELRQVRWPDRKATWGLTLAVILFSLFFAALILGLDYLFNELFRKVL